ncbi:hypothetical protein F5Y10DRAFT_57333 [Nemania abortiva]|nr:hypothetical protein F5Y10DRAFT_57333 [Nemania abortiva]
MFNTYTLVADRLWVPWTLRKPTLSALIIVSLLLAAAIEILAQKGAKDGGLSLSDSIDNIPQTSFLASSYLPTLIALIYGLLWAWVDLDARRIQPWLELSKEGGSTAQNSLFLDYPSEFLPFVPFTAARRRQWPVFYSGTIIVIVFWLITPLQSSIFGIGPIRLTRPISVSAPTSLLPITLQAPLLDNEILNDAFAITWLGRDFPAPMTAEYALLPFKADSVVPPFATDTYLKSWTWQLTTDLKCWPATINGSGSLFRMSNGRGCEVEIAFFGSTTTTRDSQYSMLYVGYYNNAWLDYYLEGPSCGKNASHQFLAISAFRNGTADIKTGANYTSITALFCQPQYLKRNVSVVLSRDILVAINASIEPNGDNVRLLDSEFNITAFEYLIGTGRPPVDIVRDFPQQRNLDQYPQLVDSRIEQPVTNMVGFAIGSRNYSAAELHDPSTLAAAYTMAHRSLFSTTVSRLLSNGANGSPVAQAEGIQYTTYGVIVSRPISVVVEALLLVVAILSACTLYHYTRYRSPLTRNPSSIGDILGILQCSQEVLKDFEDQDRSGDATLKENIGASTYFLREENETGKAILRLYRNQNARSRASRQSRTNPLGRDYKPIRPSALNPAVGASFIGFLLIGTATLAYLKQQERSLGGLIPPSSNFEVMQLLENYIPTIFATLIEPFWVLVSRVCCVIQPFSELQKGRSSPQRSVLAKYTSIPSQLVVWRSARAGQYLLTSTCLAAVLANVLALGLSGLFNDIPRVVSYNTMVKPARIAVPSRDDIVPASAGLNSYSDHFEVVLANLSENSMTPLPSWTDNANFYLPFGQPGDQSFVKGDQLKATTFGFGVETQCSPMYLNDLSGRAVVTLSSTNSTESLALFARSLNGSYEECTYAESGAPVYRLIPGRPFTREIILTGSNIVQGPCGSKAPWIAGWMRVQPTQQQPGNKTLRSMLLNCQSNLRVAKFDVTVDTDGKVIDAEDLGDADLHLEYWSSNVSQSMADEIATTNGPSVGLPIWHNETLTTDWINHLLTLMMGNRSIVDPTQEIPDATAIQPLLEDLYRRLAASLLGLNPSFFQEAADDIDLIPATILRTETRIFLSEPAFILSVSILALYLLIAVAVYARGRAILLPRMPTSLGSLLAYSVASQAVEDFTEHHEVGDNAIQRHTYTFGRYIGKDGKPHIGIERDPFVIKLDGRNFKKKGS